MNLLRNLALHLLKVAQIPRNVRIAVLPIPFFPCPYHLRSQESFSLFPTVAAPIVVATASLIPRIWNVATCHRLKVMPEINKKQIAPAAALW